MSNRYLLTPQSALCDNLQMLNNNINSSVNLLTQKGELLTHDQTKITVLQPSVDNSVLSCDSSTSTGLTWKLLDVDDLNNVTITNVTNNQVLQYDASTGQWINAAIHVSSSLSGLTDVTLTNLTNKNLLVYNSASLKWVNKNGLTTKGDLLTFDTDINRLAVGTNGQVLTADSTHSLGIKWATSTSSLSQLTDVSLTSLANKNLLVYDTGSSKWLNKNGITTKGDILTFDTDVNRLAVGTNGQVLTADSTQTLGIKWASPVTSLGGLSDVTLTSLANKNLLVYDTGSSKWLNKNGVTTKGDILTFDTDVNRLAVGTNGQVLTADSTQSLGIKWASPVTSLSGLTDVTLTSLANKNLLVYDTGSSKWLNKLGITTKGDILTFDTDLNRLAVGTNGQILTADSTQTLGIKWASPTLGGLSDVTLTSLANKNLLVYDSGSSKWLNKLGITTKGDILTFDTDLNRLAVGTNGQVLTADSTQTLGIKWASPVTSLGGLSDVTLTSLANKNLLVYDTNSSKWLNKNGITTKGDILTFDTDLNRLAVGTNGQVLTADSTQSLGIKWASPVASLSGLTDVTLTSLANKNLLVYDTGSSKWLNKLGITTKGDILTFDTDLNRLAVGTNGQILTADSTQTLGIKWATPVLSGLSDVTLTSLANKNLLVYDSGSSKWLNKLGITTKGDILTFDTDLNRLAVGTNGQVLTADSAQSLGIKWNTPISTIAGLTDVTVTNPTTGNMLVYNSSTSKWLNKTGPAAKGDLLTYGTDVGVLSVGTNNQILTADSTQTFGIKWAAPASTTLSAQTDVTITSVANKNLLVYDTSSSKWLNKNGITTKGDILTFDTDYNRLAVGTNGQVLTADSAQTLGIKWATIATPTLSILTDVTLSSLANKNLLVYNTSTAKWLNKNGITTKGDILTFDTDYNRLPVGTDGQIILADSTQALGIKWGAAPGSSLSGMTDVSVSSLANKNLLVYNSGTSKWVNKNGITTKGDILTFDTDFNRLPVGTDGQVVTADSTQALGIKWATPPGGALSTLTDVNLTVPANKNLLVYDSGTSKWLNKNGLTTKGDILTFDTDYNRLPVGTNGQVLTADSTQTLGIKWNSPTLSSMTDTNITTPANKNLLAYDTSTSKWLNKNGLTTKGDLLTFDTDVNRLPVGTNGQVLVADSTQALGIKWTNGYTTIASLNDVNITSIANKNLLIYDSGTSKWLNKPGLTTKGDILTFDTDVNRLGVGSDGNVLYADSNSTPGIRWDSDFVPFSVASQEVFDTSTLGYQVTYTNDLYYGSVFDGRYIYLIPSPTDDDGTIGNKFMIRFDTQGTLSLASSYKYFDTTSLTGSPAGFYGGTFDGTYVYMAPSSYNSVYHGKIVRYNTNLPFTSTSSYDVFDATTVNASCVGFTGAVFDGRYVYFIPNGSPIGGGTYNGILLRYDTTASFTTAGSYTAYDTAANVDAKSKGFYGGVFDGTYLYLVPGTYGTASGMIVRYTVASSFTTAGSYSKFDLTTISASLTSFNSATFDGRYIYFVPNGDNPNDAVPKNTVVQYDTTASFTTAGSYATYAITRTDCNGCAYDGKYVYFTASDTYTFVRYDTTKSFTSATSYVSYVYSGGTKVGNTVWCTDGTYIYIGGLHVMLRYKAYASKYNKLYSINNWPSNKLTTKGDLLTYSTQMTKLSVGSDSQVLTSDSTNANGIAWKTSPVGNLSHYTMQEVNSSGTYWTNITNTASTTQVFSISENTGANLGMTTLRINSWLSGGASNGNYYMMFHPGATTTIGGTYFFSNSTPIMKICRTGDVYCRGTFNNNWTDAENIESFLVT